MSWRKLRPRLRGTVRFRLALVYGSLFLVAGAGMLTVVYFLFRNFKSQPLVYRGTVPAKSFSLVGTAYPAQKAAASAAAKAAAAIATRRTAPVTIPLSTPPHGVSAVPAAAAHGVPVVVAIPRLTVYQVAHAADLHQLLVEFGAALLLMAVLATVLGWVVAGRVLRPLRTITAAARRLSSSSLHERLALTGRRDELTELADTFDEFLARLESSFEAQRRFMHHASHELRTPVARQRTVLEVALADPELSIASLRESCERVLATGEEQERLIDGLLTLAQSDQALERNERFDLAELVQRVLESRSPEINQQGFRLTADLRPALVSGEPHLLERLVANLIDNAIDHNVAGGGLEVMTLIRDGSAVLRLANDGLLLDQVAIDRLREPLEHHHASSRLGRGHHGLGLTIVQAVAQAHDASLRVSARPSGGLDIEVEFADAQVRLISAPATS